MRISRAEWEKYIFTLSRINKTAATRMQLYIDKNGMKDGDKLVEYAHALVSRYGEAAGELACELYDAVAESSGKNVPPAVIADTATYSETAKAVFGTMKNQTNTVSETVGRLVKQAAADTTLKNGLRDGAKFAWIPHGDTCAFCIMLASNGWQKISKKALKNGHAEHIHANCDCEYAISFDDRPVVEGYDPKYYEDIYKDAKGENWRQKINSIRRQQYEDAHAEGIYQTEKWIGDKLQQIMGGNYNEFANLVNSSQNKSLYNKYSESPSYVYEKNRNNSYYSVGANAVHFGYEEAEGLNKYSSEAHEIGHMFDAQMGRVVGLSYKEIDTINERCVIGSGMTMTLNPVASNSDEFMHALRADMEKLKPKVIDRSIRDEFLSTKAKRNATSGIQDALDGFYSTQKNNILPWGHGDSYYNRAYNRRISTFNNEKNLKDAFSELDFDASNQTKTKRIMRQYEAASEAFANVSSAITVGGDELRYFKQYMPKTVEAYLRIIGEK